MQEPCYAPGDSGIPPLDHHAELMPASTYAELVDALGIDPADPPELPEVPAWMQSGPDARPVLVRDADTRGLPVIRWPGRHRAPDDDTAVLTAVDDPAEVAA